MKEYSVWVAGAVIVVAAYAILGKFIIGVVVGAAIAAVYLK